MAMKAMLMRLRLNLIKQMGGRDGIKPNFETAVKGDILSPEARKRLWNQNMGIVHEYALSINP